jgi:transcriptional regulator with GAF, ATPase, and Fis domain
MNPTTYRRKAIISRVHKALDAFYLLQKIDWDYDVRAAIEKILALAMEEIEFDGGKVIERALLILQNAGGTDLEVKAGWRAEGPDLSFSRTVLQQTIARREPIFCENAKDDPRFMEAESIKSLNTLSLISVPIQFDERTAGAFYIESKSAGNVFDPDDLEFLSEFTAAITPYLKTALTHQSHMREIQNLRKEVVERYSLANIVGKSDALRNVFDLVRIAAGVDRTVLITGESGSGKELIAKAIHYNSHRRAGRLVVVDCSGLSEHLLESELFGHRRGAFTGASHDKLGAFEEANGGTIFLDEISDASKAMQQKLRRVLQEGEIRRVGETEMRRVDVRVICATNKDLPELVKSAQFIRDLYYRVNQFPIHIPPLRERRQDIPLLVHHFLEQLAASGNRPALGISPEAMENLVSRDWQDNNIRELRNAVELAADLARGSTIDHSVLERVFRVQRGNAGTRSAEQEPDGSDAPAGPLLQIHRVRFRRWIQSQKRSESGEAPAPSEKAPRPKKAPRPNGPFYRLQLELSGRAILEGLRVCGWKLRPAARALGISPMKLRGELREFLHEAIEQHASDIESVARDLEIPPQVLSRKLSDLGLDGPTRVGARR